MRDSTKIKHAVRAVIPHAQNLRAYQRPGSSFWHIALSVPLPKDCYCDELPNNWQRCTPCEAITSDLRMKAGKAVTDSGVFYSTYYPSDDCQYQANSIIVDVELCAQKAEPLTP